MRSGRPVRRNGFRPCQAVPEVTLPLGRGLMMLACLAVALLAGCSGSSAEKPDNAQLERFAKSGYTPEERFATESTQATWQLAQQQIEVTLTLATRGAKHPLVVYMPGLGEPSSGGALWREAWAAAGYAVVSVQPLADDAASRPRRARARDIAGSARERYAAQVVNARVATLVQLLTEVTKRQAANEAPWNRIDASRAAVAGYEIGAYSATVIAGEGIKGKQPPALPAKVVAAIALSPYADFSGLSFAERYRSIRVPVLCITSDFDTDAASGVSAATLRKAPFDYMPAGGKYFLLLSSAPHALLSGHGAPTAEEVARAKAAAEQESRARKAQPDELAGDLDDEDATQKSKNRAPTPRIDVQFTPTDREMRTAAVEVVSIAFLDAYLRSDPVALEWFQKDAARWLGKNGQLLQR